MLGPNWNSTCPIVPLIGWSGIVRLLFSLLILLTLQLAFVTPNAVLRAQEEGASTEPLDERQQLLAVRYQRLEKMLEQMAQYMWKTDPERAELLMRAISQSKQNRISDQMQQIAILLDQQQLGEAVDRQTEAVKVLEALFQLLQSQDRLSEIESEQERIQEILKDLKQIAAKEKNLRIATERGGDLERLSDKQSEIAEQNQKLSDKIKEQDKQRSGEDEDKNGKSESQEGENANGENSDGQKSDGEKSDGEKSDGEKSDGEKSDGEKSDGEKSDSEKSDGDAKPSDSDQQQQNQDGSQGQQSEQGQQSQQSQQSQQGQQGQQGDQQQQQQTPGRQEIEEAQQNLEQAIEELKEQQRENATEEQQKALDKLLAAKEKLEEILRQLREEERELVLASLEARFRKMLALQLAINTDTLTLSETPTDKWSSRHFGQVRELSIQEQSVELEATKALSLLREEGSSVAFPEAVDQLLEDVKLVVKRLQNEDVGDFTRAVEADIVTALEEIIGTLQQEMEKQSQQQQGGQQGGGGQPQDPGLVEQIAELKMLRTLQYRVNRRTTQIGQMIPGEEVEEQEQRDQLRDLAQRQDRIREAAYDISTKKNQ